MEPLLKANYHTHTTRCGHASGTDREYVEAAIEAGYEILGFSDHTPYPTNPDFVSGMRIKLEETDNYFDSVTSLKKEYANDITIYAGVEAEYFPEHFHKLLDYMKDYPLDYMIMGEHFIPDEQYGRYVGSPFRNPQWLEMYTENVLAGLKTGKFAYLAHPDLPFYVGENAEELLKESYSTICKAAKELNVPLEINVLGSTRDSSIYPASDFLDIAAATGNDMILGIDAHSPAQLKNTPYIEKCLKMATDRGLNILEKMNI
ncbi:MAG: histidinol-phosphatase HisJ family protein [Lachnospiraceae bacterium]|nr:histidinol-phosphatase HisJ family protein [Lachnospiraceae bacterium]